MFEHFSKIDEDFGGSISWNTQPNCRVCSLILLISFQHGHYTFFTILIRPFARLFIILAMRIRALFSKSATTLGLVRTSILEGATFHRNNWCKFLWGTPCKANETFSHWDFFLRDFDFSTHFSHSAAWKNWEMDSAVSFSHVHWCRAGNCNCLL